MKTGDMMKQENNVILYQDDNEVTRVSVRFADEDLWLTQNQLAKIYDTTQQNIAQHIAGIYRDNELDEATHKKFLLVQTEGTRQVKRNIEHYNLDMIIALGVSCSVSDRHTIPSLGNAAASRIYSERVCDGR